MIFSRHLYSKGADTTLVHYQGNKFYHITVHTHTNVLIFLHGGVNNPKFHDTSQISGLNFLLEENNLFIRDALMNGFDVLIPITNDSLNWLTNHSYCFQYLSSFLDKSKKYANKYISGFSDGGIGSYKIFYDNTQYFDGLLVFNGYPQHQNFYQHVDYKKVTNKKILFFSTLRDKVIPYEFLLTEYIKQKEYNANTFLYVVKGGHSFAAYDSIAINNCFKILTSTISNSKHDKTHGFLVNDQLVEFYLYRKVITRKYNYGMDTYQENLKQRKKFKK